jgi:cytochrome P450
MGTRAQMLGDVAAVVLAVTRPHPVRVAVDGRSAAGKTRAFLGVRDAGMASCPPVGDRRAGERRGCATAAGNGGNGMTTAPTIDLLSPDSFADGQPHGQFRWLRTHEPVFRHPEPEGPGFWAVTRYADLRAVERDYATFSSEPTIMIEDMDEALGVGDHKMMLMSDPPLHTHYRKLVHREFTPRAAAALRGRIETLARSIVDAVIERGECDLVTDLAGELPSYVIAELLGIPLDDGRRLYELTETIHAAPQSQPEGAGTRAALEMFGYATQVAADKRVRPGPDLASRLLHGEVDGERLDEIDFNLFFLLLVDAGGDTTRNLVAGGMLALFDDPHERHRLQSSLDAMLPGAVEEMLRYVSPVVYMRRTATRDAEIAGRPVSAGDKVVLYYGSANRDEAVFDEPDDLLLDRAPNDHVAFGDGRHFCLGAHLARLEIAALLREILSRLPDVEPAGPAEWLPSNFISGPRRLPVRFTPGASSR